MSRIIAWEKCSGYKKLAKGLLKRDNHLSLLASRWKKDRLEEWKEPRSVSMTPFKGALKKE